MVHEALEELAIGDPDTAKLVKLHFFAGLTIREAAEAMGLSERTAGVAWPTPAPGWVVEIRRGLVA